MFTPYIANIISVYIVLSIMFTFVVVYYLMFYFQEYWNLFT